MLWQGKGMNRMVWLFSARACRRKHTGCRGILQLGNPELQLSQAPVLLAQNVRSSLDHLRCQRQQSCHGIDLLGPLSKPCGHLQHCGQTYSAFGQRAASEHNRLRESLLQSQRVAANPGRAEPLARWL